MKKNKKIAVIFGGRSHEREISIKTGRGVLKSLVELGYDAVGLDIDKPSIRKLCDDGFDLAFIALHGKYGEDGSIQGLLEILEIPYTGSSVMSSSIAMNKAFCQQIMKENGIKIADSIIVSREDESEGKFSDDVNNFILKFGGCVLKPVDEGSSIGLQIVKNQDEFRKKLKEVFKYSDKALVEAYIEGTEITVGVIGNKNPESLPPVEIVPRGEFFNFECKYQKGKTDYYVPARISPEHTERAKEIAGCVHRILELRGFSWSDFIIKGGEIFFLEVNTIPGMTETSLLPKAAKSVGIGYNELVERIVQYAISE